MKAALLALAFLLLATPALATERVDLYDTKGQRTGYAIIDRDSGRVDFFDAQSRRTAYGTVDGAGKAERFDLKGRRETPSVVPLPRKGMR